MYKYAASDSIFDGVSNIYLVSIATAFLAVIMAFYCSNFLKDESETQLKEVLNEVGDSEEEEENDNYFYDTELENHYETQELQKKCYSKELNNKRNNEDNGRRNSISIYENSDTDEICIDGLVSKIKSKRVKDLEAQLTEDQLQEERRIEREQLAAIFELLKKQEAELNMKEIDESELNAQLSLYR